MMRSLGRSQPRVFIGSASEGLSVARAIQANLQSFAEVVVWEEAAVPMNETLRLVLEAVNSADFAVFVLTPDDQVISRGLPAQAMPRDNVLLEIGLAMGALGRERTFLVAPARTPLKLPSDLSGITLVEYLPVAVPETLVQALEQPTARIQRQIEERYRRVHRQGATIDANEWTYTFPFGLPVEALYLRSAQHSQAALIDGLDQAKKHFRCFGLTRNFLLSNEVRPILERKGQEIPCTLYMMDPDSESRRDRYRIEPLEAALESPERYKSHILKPYRELLAQTPKLKIFLYNFPCSFAIEEIDDLCRVMLYGHGVRGTDGPILVFRAGNPYYEYFISQMRWLEELASHPTRAPWNEKGLRVTSVTPLTTVSD